MTSEIDAWRGILFVVDARRDEGRRFIVRSNELLTAFLELDEQLRRPPVPHAD